MANFQKFVLTIDLFGGTRPYSDDGLGSSDGSDDSSLRA